MAGNQISFQIIDKEVREKIADLQKAGADMTPALNVVGRTIADRIRLGFKFSRSPYGEPWEPLHIRAGQPLRNSGRFQASIVPRVGGTGSEQYVEVGTNFGPLSRGGSIARVHQYGAVIKPRQAKFLRFMGSNGYVFSKRVVIPARPFMPIKGNEFVLPDTWAKAVIQQLKRHFDKIASSEA